MQGSEPDVRWVIPEKLTEEQVADGQERLKDLARALGRCSAKASHKLGIRFEMDDPMVAREVVRLTFEGLFLSSDCRPSKRKVRAPKAGERPE